MRISYRWLGDLVDHQQKPEEVAEILTHTGLEVEETLHYSTGPKTLNGLVVGEVEEVKDHPNADKLKLTRVNTGGSKKHSIVCGAPNVAKGQKVVVAPAGTELTNIKGDKLKVEKARIRGETSEGMIVAEDEIGLSEDHSGVMVLAENARVGAPPEEYLNIYEDQIFEIDLTPNRTDAMSHLGVARDLAAVLRKPLKKPFKAPGQSAGRTEREKSIKISIDDPQACPRYSGVVVSGVKVQSSPEWMQNRLNVSGIQPVNNIVDATNYVLLELGHPLHAFDLEELKGNAVRIGFAEPGSSFVTLDGEKRTMDGIELMIFNEREAVAMAGIMGGSQSGITGDTRDIFIESAYFDPVITRKASRKHQLMTEASFRFERGADPNITVQALQRVTDLIMEIAGGKVASEIIDEYPGKIDPAEIPLEYNYLDRILGNKLHRDEIKDILRHLEFDIKKETPEGLIVLSPTFRTEVTRPADLTEEIIRIYSLNEIQFDRRVKMHLNPHHEIRREELFKKISGYLIANGFYEMINPPFTGGDRYSRFPEFEKNGEPVSLVNPLSREENYLRNNLLFSALETVLYNINRQNEHLKLYELGRAYYKEGGRFRERSLLSMVLAGNIAQESWYQESRPVNFHYFKGLVENVLAIAGIEDHEFKEIRDELYFSYGMEIFSGKRSIGKFGLVKPQLLKQYDLKQSIFYGVFSRDALEQNYEHYRVSLESIPRFPSISRDLSMLVPENTKFVQLKSTIQKEGGELLKKINIFDVYEGDKIEKGFKSYAIRMVFQEQERTLKDREVDKIMDRVMKALENKEKAIIRK